MSFSRCSHEEMTISNLHLTYIFQIAMSYLSNYSIFFKLDRFPGSKFIMPSLENDLNDYRNFGADHFVG